jgi:hypothetical protein
MAFRITEQEIEAVAKAMWDVDCPNDGTPAWDALGPGDSEVKAAFRRMALAGIRAWLARPPRREAALRRGTPIDEAVENFKPGESDYVRDVLRTAGEAFGGDDKPDPPKSGDPERKAAEDD